MYLRRTTRSYKGRTYTNYQLVESVRTPDGPRQRTICSLGDLGPGSAEEWLKRARQLEHALLGQADLIDSTDGGLESFVDHVRNRRNARAARPVRQAPRFAANHEHITVDPRRVSTEHHREAGPVHVGYQFWQRLGLNEILQQLELSDTVRQLACVMTLNRLIQPASEHAMPAWIRRTALADILATNFDALEETALYRTLDQLYPHRVAIERALVERERSLFNLDPAIYLYDLTSTYFEGVAAANPKAKRGHSRDKRPECKQVVVGLVVGREGFPICHEVLAGNTQDVTTLTGMLDRLAERVGLAAGATIVIDRGLASAANLAVCKDRKLHFVIAARQSERDRWLANFDDKAGFTPVLRQPSATNPAQKKPRVDVQMQRRGDLVYVLCRSEGRIAKDRAIRHNHERRLLADIDKLQRRIAKGRLKKPSKIAEAIGRLKERYPRVARYYDLAHDPESNILSAPRLDSAYETAEQLDGTYLLKTDRTDLSADEAWRIYSLLTRAEDAFRDMKTPLAERPIFHRREHRVDTHIFLCVLAYHLLVSIEKTLLDQNIHTSWGTVRETLKTHQVCTIVLPTKDGRCLRIRKAANPEPEVQDLYARLNVSADVIKPIHTWSEAPM
jgi:transposase